MSDTITLPSGVEVDQGRVLVIPGAGVVMPVGDLTPSEVQALQDDVQAVLNQELGDLSNVSEAGKAEGMVLGALADGTWSPQVLTGKLDQVSTNWPPGATKNVPDVSWITLDQGIDINTGVSTGGRVHLQLVWGASGTQNVVARANHTHPPSPKGRYTFTKTGEVLSAGTSPLVDETVSGLIPGVVYDVDIRGTLEVVNTHLSGRIRLVAKIGTTAEHTVSRGASGGVWSEKSVTSTRMSITGVSSLRLQFWAEYESGDPTALYTGDLTYTVEPRGGQP